MKENPAQLGNKPLLRPVRVLGAQSGDLHLARRPIELLSQMQPPLARHGTKDFNLFRAGLFIGQHGARVSLKGRQSKLSSSCKVSFRNLTKSRYQINSPLRAASFPAI